MKALARITPFAALLLLALTLTGCNTTEGIGEDISAIGQGLANVASDTNPSKE